MSDNPVPHPNLKVVVITGSSRGIGRGLADAFLARGCQVMISSRSESSVQNCLDELSRKYPQERIAGQVCDVTVHSQIESLWAAAQKAFGQVDIWINNAGISLPPRPLWEQDQQALEQIIDINLKGVAYGCLTAVRSMKQQGFGQIYNMEGFGSDGRTMKGMTAYGSTKSAVAYLTKSLAKECKGSVVQVSALSPGMVVTDLLMQDVDQSSPAFERTRKVFNMLADRVETVTPWMVNKVLSGPRNGGGVRWLTTPKILWRIMSAPFLKRQIID